MSWGYRHRHERSLAPLPLTYKAHLPRFNSQTLKEMARAWVGSSAYKLNRSACTAAILEVLANKKALRAMVQLLSPFEQAGLGLLKLRGYTAPTEEIAMELMMLGLPFSRATSNPAYLSGEKAPITTRSTGCSKRGLSCYVRWI